MSDWKEQRVERLREFFELGAEAELIGQDAAEFKLSPEAASGLAHFNIEWHVVPPAQTLPLDDAYMARLYPQQRGEHALGYRKRLSTGHARHQGQLIGVETTMKPRYLPGNRQFYGTAYGHDPLADPLASYMGRAGMVNGMRYDHNYLSLRAFLRVVSEDWQARSLVPAGYRVTVCPPAIFNLVGTIFHPEWSETETLELGFYRDERGNATCYVVGSNARGDFSYINEVEGEGDWSLAGFRLALVPDN
jgi:hypothetical protein